MVKAPFFHVLWLSSFLVRSDVCVCICVCAPQRSEKRTTCAQKLHFECVLLCKAFSCWSNTFLLTPTASKHVVHQIHIITRIGHVIVEYYNVLDVSANRIQALHGCIFKLQNII